MRTAGLAVLLLAASCGPLDQMLNQSSAEREPTRTAPAPTITIVATGPDGCSASWDGQTVTPSQITERSVALLERAIAAAGGPQNVTEGSFPVPDITAPADLAFACADTILFALQRSGLMSIRLIPAGGAAPVPAYLPQDAGAPPPVVPMVLGIGAGGQLTWNDAPIDAARLAAELGRIGSTTPPDAGEGEPPPGGMELRVRREATFGQVYDLLRTTQRYHLRPFLYLPSAEAGGGAAGGTAPPPPGGS